MSGETDLTGANVKHRDDVVHERIAENVWPSCAVLRSGQAIPCRGVHIFLHQHISLANVEDCAIDLDTE